MKEWFSNLSKSARIGLVISIVWFVIISAIALDAGEIAILLILGVIPMTIGWGIRYIRQKSD